MIKCQCKFVFSVKHIVFTTGCKHTFLLSVTGVENSHLATVYAVTYSVLEGNLL